MHPILWSTAMVPKYDLPLEYFFSHSNKTEKFGPIPGVTDLVRLMRLNNMYFKSCLGDFVIHKDLWNTAP